MDINQVMTELDELFTQERMAEVPSFLERNIDQARKEGAQDILLTLYNECIGFYRETGQYDKSIEYCTMAVELMDSVGMQDTLPYATTLLNAANAYRAAGYLQESLDLYGKVRPIYVAQLEEDDMYFAGLYNNLSLLYQEMGNFEAAKEQLENALHIVSHKPDSQFEVAVTQANLANTCIELGLDDEAKARAEEAISIFEQIGVDDAHYSAALSALGSLYYMDKDYANALATMEKSRECVAKYLGADNIQYRRLSDNIKIIKDKMTLAESRKAQDEEKAVDAMIAEVMDEIAVEVEETAETAQCADTQDNQHKPIMAEEAVDIKDIDQYLSKESVSQVTEGSEEVPEKIEQDVTVEVSEEAFIPDDNLEESVAVQDTATEAENGCQETQQEEVSQAETAAETPEQDVLAETAAETPEQDVLTEAAQPEDSSGLEPEEDLTPDISGMELCRQYYEEYGRPMIAEKFPAYESAIAVGLVGKGSDCFGFDDMQSRDHDFGPRFFMWVTREVYDEIGEELAAAYDALPDSFMGVARTETAHGKDRAGVMVIEEFYKSIIGFDLLSALQQDKINLATMKSWLSAHDYALAACVNGAVFRDDTGIFTEYREKLSMYYPKAVWYRKIANACALFSQNGQYNLPRMRRRGQFVAAELAKAECMRQAMKLYYLLNRTYAPHDKWLYRGLPVNPEMEISETGTDVQNAASLVEKIQMLPVDKAHAAELDTDIELLAVIFANELENQNIIGHCDLYLDGCTTELMVKSDALLAAAVADNPVTTALSLAIAKAEFEAFDKVENEGGRAGCQNNWPTFKTMRMSQYMTWEEDMLLQYLYEFKSNYAKGRNMIQEKYARMMESTAPQEYAQFAEKLPPVSDGMKAIMEQIIALQVNWMEEFAAQYPKLAGNARLIHTSEDMPYETSYETYLRGELGTYSERMLEMYGRYIVNYARSGRNVAREIMENTVHFYGYQDLESAEQHEALNMQMF